MNASTIAAVGLGSGGCLFLRDLPADRSLIGTRIAVDADPKVLRSLDPQEADIRLRILLPARFRKRPFAPASDVVRDVLTSSQADFIRALPPPGTLLLVAIALGGVTGSSMAAQWLPQLPILGYRLVSLVLMPGPGTEAALYAETLLPLVARNSLSLCAVNPQPLAQALPGSFPVQRLFAMTSLLRVGHALDWQRLSGMLVHE